MKTSILAFGSPAFADGDELPLRFARPEVGGENASPPLEWHSPPAGTRSFALAVIDLHPVARGFAHWLADGIPVDATSLAEGASGKAMPGGARELYNSAGLRGWSGPRPPAGTGDHEYRFTLYALDVPRLSVHDSAGGPMFVDEAQAHAIATADLSGYFGR